MTNFKQWSVVGSNFFAKTVDEAILASLQRWHSKRLPETISVHEWLFSSGSKKPTGEKSDSNVADWLANHGLADRVELRTVVYHRLAETAELKAEAS